MRALSVAEKLSPYHPRSLSISKTYFVNMWSEMSGWAYTIRLLIGKKSEGGEKNNDE